MGTQQNKIRGAGVRALSLFRQIKRIQQQGLDGISVNIEKLIQGLIDKKELDQKTIEILQEVYLGRKNEVQVANDRISHALETFRKELRNTKQDGVSTVLLFLSISGDLYKKPREKYCYSLKKSGLRIDIIRFLMGQKQFISGQEIADAIGTSYGSTTFAINKINTISRNHLGFPKGKSNDLIISRDRGGYKLNLLYPIIQE